MFNLLEGTQGVLFKPSCGEPRCWRCKSQISTRQRQKQACLGEFKASLTNQVPGPAGLHKERLWLTVGKRHQGPAGQLLRDEEYLLLCMRTWVSLPAPTWQLPNVHNSRDQVPSGLHGYQVYTQCIYKHAGKEKKTLIQIKKKRWHGELPPHLSA